MSKPIKNLAFVFCSFMVFLSGAVCMVNLAKPKPDWIDVTISSLLGLFFSFNAKRQAK